MSNKDSNTREDEKKESRIPKLGEENFVYLVSLAMMFGFLLILFLIW